MNPNELDEVEVMVSRDEPGEKQYQFTSDFGIACFPKSQVSFKSRNTKTGVAIAQIPVWLMQDRGWLKSDKPKKQPVAPTADDMPD
jgi:hypothetical protein